MLNKKLVNFKDFNPTYNTEFRYGIDFKLTNATKLANDKCKEVFNKCRDSFKNLKLLEHIDDDKTFN
jgi:hypothetical protein